MPGTGTRKASSTAASPGAGRGQGQREYHVPALERGLGILETLSASPVPLSLSELARALKYAPGSLFRLLSLLERQSYINRDAVSGKYSLTLKLLELAHTHSPADNLLRVAHAPMRELAGDTGESVHLSVIAHGALVVLLDVGSPWRVRISVEVGSRFPVIHTTSGRLLLAHMSSEELEAFLARDQDYAGLDAPTKAAFERELQTIRRCGYSLAVRDQSGANDVSVLVGNPTVGAAAALAIACYKRHGSKSETMELVRAMQACAARITASQGLSAGA